MALCYTLQHITQVPSNNRQHIDGSIYLHTNRGTYIKVLPYTNRGRLQRGSIYNKDISHIALSGTKSNRYCISFYRGLSPHTSQHQQQKRNGFPLPEYLQSVKYTVLYKVQTFPTLRQTEAERLKASQVFRVQKAGEK